MGPWASAPVPSGYTFGVEIEVAVFGWHSLMDDSSDDDLCMVYDNEPGLVPMDLEVYLQVVGCLPEGWRWVQLNK
jgi:hypothetical protein